MFPEFEELRVQRPSGRRVAEGLRGARDAVDCHRPANRLFWRQRWGALLNVARNASLSEQVITHPSMRRLAAASSREVAQHELRWRALTPRLPYRHWAGTPASGGIGSLH